MRTRLVAAITALLMALAVPASASPHVGTVNCGTSGGYVTTRSYSYFTGLTHTHTTAWGTVRLATAGTGLIHTWALGKLYGYQVFTTDVAGWRSHSASC